MNNQIVEQETQQEIQDNLLKMRAKPIDLTKVEELPLLVRIEEKIVYSLVTDGRGSSKNYNLFIGSLKELSEIYSGIKKKWITDLIKAHNYNPYKCSEKLDLYLERAEQDGVVSRALKGQAQRTNLLLKPRKIYIESKNIAELKGKSTNVVGINFWNFKQSVVRGLNYQVKHPTIL